MHKVQISNLDKALLPSGAKLAIWTTSKKYSFFRLFTEYLNLVLENHLMDSFPMSNEFLPFLLSLLSSASWVH